MLSVPERVEGFRLLEHDDAENFFLHLSARDKAELISALSFGERRVWMRLLAPEEALDVIQELPEPERAGILSLLDDKTRRGVKGLMSFVEEQSRGLINLHYVRLRPDMTVDEAVSFLRRDARDRAQMTYYAYVTDPQERLLGVVSFRDLLITPGDRKVQDVMRTDVITAPEDVDAAELMGLFRRYNLQMIPLLDSERRIKRMVTREEIGDDVSARA